MYESTDDAEVDGHLMPLSARITGYVIKVNVDDNQYVDAGTVLAEIDPRDYQVALDQANAQLADAQATAQALNINVPIASVNSDSQISVDGSGRRKCARRNFRRPGSIHRRQSPARSGASQRRESAKRPDCVTNSSWTSRKFRSSSTTRPSPRPKPAARQSHQPTPRPLPPSSKSLKRAAGSRRPMRIIATRKLARAR